MDRNEVKSFNRDYQPGSLSARRAWIEISGLPVAYRLWPESLSARRAWIEIGGTSPPTRAGCVALRKESVDRNA